MINSTVTIAKRLIIDSSSAEDPFEKTVCDDVIQAVNSTKSQLLQAYPNARKDILDYQNYDSGIWSFIEETFSEALPFRNREIVTMMKRVRFKKNRYVLNEYHVNLLEVRNESQPFNMEVVFTLDYVIDEFVVVGVVGNTLYLSEKRDYEDKEKTSGDLLVFPFLDGEDGFCIRAIKQRQ